MDDELTSDGLARLPSDCMLSYWTVRPVWKQFNQCLPPQKIREEPAMRRLHESNAK